MTLRIVHFIDFLLIFAFASYLAVVGAEEEQVYDKLYPGPKYTVRLETAQHPDADSPNTEVRVEGKTSVTYLQPSKHYAQKLLTYYVADKNGFRARFNFSEVEYPPLKDRLSPGALKSAAG